MSADPASAHLQRGLHLARVRRFAEAEAAFKDALQGDPENAFVLYQLTLVQWQQAGRERDALATIQQAVRCAPNESDIHALQANQHKDAERHFREALRLNPENEFAREGLIESFRARSRFYRLHLRWLLWMQARSDKMQWAVILGLLILPRIIRRIFTGPAAAVGALLVGLVLLFVLWVHVARGFGNLIVFTDRFARMALRRGEKLEAFFVGGFIVAALALAAAGVVIGEFLLLIIAATLVAAAVPFSHTFTNKSAAGRWIFGAIGAFALIAGGLIVFQPLIAGILDAKTAVSIGSAAFLFSVLSTWLCNIPGLRQR